jgi:hypothetical protein
VIDVTVLLLAVLAVAVLALLAQAFGVDSRDWSTRGEHRPWL